MASESQTSFASLMAGVLSRSVERRKAIEQHQMEIESQELAARQRAEQIQLASDLSLENQRILRQEDAEREEEKAKNELRDYEHVSDYVNSLYANSDPAAVERTIAEAFNAVNSIPEFRKRSDVPAATSYATDKLFGVGRPPPMYEGERARIDLLRAQAASTRARADELIKENAVTARDIQRAMQDYYARNGISGVRPDWHMMAAASFAHWARRNDLGGNEVTDVEFHQFLTSPNDPEIGSFGLGLPGHRWIPKTDAAAFEIRSDKFGLLVEDPTFQARVTGIVGGMEGPEGELMPDPAIVQRAASFVAGMIASPQNMINSGSNLLTSRDLAFVDFAQHIGDENAYTRLYASKAALVELISPQGVERFRLPPGVVGQPGVPFIDREQVNSLARSRFGISDSALMSPLEYGDVVSPEDIAREIYLHPTVSPPQSVDVAELMGRAFLNQSVSIEPEESDFKNFFSDFWNRELAPIFGGRLPEELID